MKIRTSASVAALATAALGLSLLGGTSASAADTAPTKSDTDSYSYKPPAGAESGPKMKRSTRAGAEVSATPVFDITSVTVEDAVLYKPGFNEVESVMNFAYEGSPDDIEIIKPLIGIGGTARGRGLIMPWDEVWPPENNEFALLTKASYGVGQARLGSFQIKYSDGTVGVDNVKSNYFRIRVASDGVFNVARYGSTVKFATKVVKFHPAKGKFVGHAGAKAYIQFNTADGWKTLKALTLDSDGRGKYAFKPNSPHSYRIFVPDTTNVLGGNTTGTDPI